MTIRNANLADKESISSLSDQINQDHFENMPKDFKAPDATDRDWDHWLARIHDGRRIFLVADDGEGVIGFIAGRVIESGKSSYLIPKMKLQIATIIVERKARGRGVGKTLVESALVAGRDLGATEVFLEVMAYNTGAQRFYESLGFEDFSRKLSMQLPAQPNQ